MTTTNSETKMSRAEVRRLWKEHNRSEGYKKTGFFDDFKYSPFVARQSKYMPHIGKKQIGRGH